MTDTPSPGALAMADSVFICVHDTDTRRNIALAIDRAVAAERERCAKIAFNCADEHPDNYEPLLVTPWASACGRILGRIRSGDQP